MEYKSFRHCYDSTWKRSTAQTGIEPRPAAVEADALTTRPTRQWLQAKRDEQSLAGKGTHHYTVDALTTIPRRLWLQAKRDEQSLAGKGAHHYTVDALTTILWGDAWCNGLACLLS